MTERPGGLKTPGLMFTWALTRVTFARYSAPMPKPVVTYTDTARAPLVGHRAFVQALDHPRHLPGTWVATSPVISVNGEKFETCNTRYIPGIRDADPPKRFSVELKSDALTVRGWKNA